MMHIVRQAETVGRRAAMARCIRRWLPSLPVMMLSFAEAAAQAALAPAGTDPRPSVEVFLQGYLQALAQRQEAAVRAACVTDGRFSWLEEGQVRYRSADEVLAGLKGFAPGAPVLTELSGLTVVPLAEEAAYAWAHFKTTVGAPPSGFAFGGAISLVLERQGQTWVIVGGHTSSERRRQQGVRPEVEVPAWRPTVATTDTCGGRR